jgi:hypothetical protein
MTKEKRYYITDEKGNKVQLLCNYCGCEHFFKFSQPKGTKYIVNRYRCLACSKVTSESNLSIVDTNKLFTIMNLLIKKNPIKKCNNLQFWNWVDSAR